jgi:hypothetical protein
MNGRGVLPEMVLEEKAEMSASEHEAALARLQSRQEQIEHELKQVERQMVAARLQVITVEQRIARLSRSQQRPAA